MHGSTRRDASADPTGKRNPHLENQGRRPHSMPVGERQEQETDRAASQRTFDAVGMAGGAGEPYF
jgi:hypothetical protein